VHPAVAQHLPAIRALCERHGVRTLTLFGSAADPARFDDTRSDVDMLVEFRDPHLGPWMKRLFDLRRDLEGVLGRRVDLAPAGALRGPFVSASAAQTGVPLYAAA
jgi:predicted nucleotidyltransferase